MAKDEKLKYQGAQFDMRRPEQKLGDFLSLPEVGCSILVAFLLGMIVSPQMNYHNNFIFIISCLFFMWYRSRNIGLKLKYPMQVKGLKHHKECAKANGILYVGNQKASKTTDDREIWLSNTDARTHILFLGTTGSGKTEGLKLLSTNALTWGSGFVYVDGKADTELWASLYSLARRFGRDDDLLLLNYMTGNSDDGGKSNSMNPFANGSSSYLTNLLVGLMDEAGGDNAMWKGRAISLMTAIMPALTWKRDHEDLLLDVDTIRNTLTLDKVVALSRNKNVPKKIAKGVYGYLDTLPGFVDSAFDDEGKEKPQGPDDPPHDLSTCYQQHGFLSMQFTRSLGSLADEYGYIFKQNLADIDIHDVVLNRRMMVVLIPILEKSGDEAANLGKIVSSSIKGMMGATLGADIEGSWEDIIENKVTKSSSPFVTIFDEVGYYTSQGMAAMAAQARSLGFSLVFAGQDLAAMEKRVKEEAKSITANCNLKIFGKLEDPGPTKEFFEKNVGKMPTIKQGNLELKSGLFSNKVVRKESLSVDVGAVVGYDDLRRQKPGHVHMIFEAKTIEAQMPWIQAPKLKAIRMQMLLKVVPGVQSEFKENYETSNVLMDKYRDLNWTADKDTAVKDMPADEIIDTMKEGYAKVENPVESGTKAVASLFDADISDVADGSLDEFSKFFGEAETEESKEANPVDFPKTFSQQMGEDSLLEDNPQDDFTKMLESYKSDSFDDTPPFANVEETEPPKTEEEKTKIYKPTIDLTNTLPWEEQDSQISDDVVHQALNEIWGREKVTAPIVNPAEKREMSGEFLQAMKKYLRPDTMDRKAVVNAVLRATADLISDGMIGDSSQTKEVSALKELAEEVLHEEEVIEEVVEEIIKEDKQQKGKEEKPEEDEELIINQPSEDSESEDKEDKDEDFSEFFS